MSITLSSDDLAKLARGVQLLTSPLDYPGVDEWRSAVNRHLRELLRADSAGFLLPVSEGLPMYSERHDPASLAKFHELDPPDLSDGTPVWEHFLKMGVGRLQDAYGRDLDRYHESPYYNEYAGPNGANHALTAAIPLGGTDLQSIATLHLWKERPDDSLFEKREVALLQLLFPAFRAGVESQFRWGGHRNDLLNTVDALGQAVIVCDMMGRALHQTPALGALLEADPDGDALRAEMLEVAEAMRQVVVASARGGALPEPGSAAVREARTRNAGYTIRGSIYGGPPAGSISVVLVALERNTPAPLPDVRAVRRRFGVTPRQAQVALLLAGRRSSKEIAAALGISRHTARHHVEQVLAKMGVLRRNVGEALREIDDSSARG